MSVLQRTIDMFQDNSELGAIQQDFQLLYASTEKVRRGAYAKITAQQKQIDQLRDELALLKKHLGIENEKTLDVSDLPLLQFA